MEAFLSKCFRENINTLKEKKKMIRYITDDLEISPGDSEEEIFSFNKCVKKFLKC